MAPLTGEVTLAVPTLLVPARPRSTAPGALLSRSRDQRPTHCLGMWPRFKPPCLAPHLDEGMIRRPAMEATGDPTSQHTKATKRGRHEGSDLCEGELRPTRSRHRTPFQASDARPLALTHPSALCGHLPGSPALAQVCTGPLRARGWLRVGEEPAEEPVA